jgi:hypothetical protein
VRKNIGVLVHTLNFGAMQKNVGVQVRMLNLALCGVHTHIEVHTVCKHIIMVRVVCAVLAECKGVWLVCTHYGYMLLRNSLVNGACRISTHDTKTVCNG